MNFLFDKLLETPQVNKEIEGNLTHLNQSESPFQKDKGFVGTMTRWSPHCWFNSFFSINGLEGYDKKTLTHARKGRKGTCWLWGWWVRWWISVIPIRMKISRGSWQFFEKISTLYIYSLIIIVLQLVSLLPSEDRRYIMKVDKALAKNGSIGRTRKNLWQEGSYRINNLGSREKLY